MPDQLARQRSTTLLFYGCLFLLAYLMYLLFRPFLSPLAWAAILAAFFYPRYKRLESRYGHTLAASLSTTAVTLIIVVPFVLLAIAFVQEASQTFNSIDLTSSSSRGFARIQRAWAWLQRQRFGRNLGSLDNLIKQYLDRATGLVATGASIVFRNMVVVIAELIVMLFALFFFFRDGDAIIARLRRVLPFETAFQDKWIAESAILIRASISSGLIVALVQGAAGGIAFAILGLGGAVFWGVTMAFFALLPLGAGVVWAPAAAWLLLTGQTGRGIALIIIGVGAISLIDNFLRPILLAGRTEMNGLLVFISLLGGLAAFGLLGLVLGPIIMATAVSLADAYVTERRREREKALHDVHGKNDRRGHA